MTVNRNENLNKISHDQDLYFQKMARKLSLFFSYVFVLVVKKHTETHVWICRETGLHVLQDRVDKRVNQAKFQLVTPSKKDI